MYTLDSGLAQRLFLKIISTKDQVQDIFMELVAGCLQKALGYDLF